MDNNTASPEREDNIGSRLEDMLAEPGRILVPRADVETALTVIKGLRDYANKLNDDAIIGAEFVSAIDTLTKTDPRFRDWAPAESYAEIITDLVEMVDQAAAGRATPSILEGVPTKLIADCKEAAARLANQADGHRLADAVLQMAELVVNLNSALEATCDLAEKATAHLAADRQLTIAEASPSASADEAEPAPGDRDRRSLIQRLDMLSTRLSEVSWGSKSTRQRVKSLLHEAITALATSSSPPAAEPSEAEVEAARRAYIRAMDDLLIEGNIMPETIALRAALIAAAHARASQQGGM